MKSIFLFIFIILLSLNTKSQFSCNDMFYNEDSLIVINGELFSGYCDNFNKHGKIDTRSYFGYGILDSIIYFDKNGFIEAVEPYKNEMINGTLKSYYKSGALKQSISYIDDKHFGLWREYYENGNIKYEADYINDYTTKNDSYCTWTKKGAKYLHTCKTISKEKKIGKLTSYSNYTKCKRIKVKITCQ